jgi:hypothetical protein
MDDLVYFFVAGLAVAGLLTSISVWAPRRVVVKAAAVMLAVLLIPLGYASLASLLSRPKPVALEWLQKQAPEATVLGSSLEEGVRIFVWLRMPGAAEPRAYVLPWNQKLAQQLQDAQREAEKNGSGEVRMRTPFEPSWDNREPKFYAAPQPAMPPKDGGAPSEPATTYRHPSTEA